MREWLELWMREGNHLVVTHPYSATRARVYVYLVGMHLTSFRYIDHIPAMAIQPDLIHVVESGPYRYINRFPI